ncbi:hypothetical protein PR048_021790 [Dryococelus australis]|uniref:Uncharacterized protein n=1 Tax=Dryococelus australis TaxID=614101 RepID=A0ABQ9GZ61_9NEOP|nr:hypothetical protein PR048_021790 [Dryococelus australis]
MEVDGKGKAVHAGENTLTLLPKKTSRLAASSSIIPTSKNPGATPPGFEPSSPWWEESSLTTTPPQLQAKGISIGRVTAATPEQSSSSRVHRGIAPSTPASNGGPADNPWLRLHTND